MMPSRAAEANPALRWSWEILGKRVADPHMHAAFDLSGASFRVDSTADVVSRNDALQPPIVAENDHLRSIAEGQMRCGLLSAAGVPGFVVKLQT